MAQAIHCDFEGHREGLADVMLSQLENGDTSAWCYPHFIAYCAAVMEQAEQQADAAAIEQRLAAVEGVQAPPQAAEQTALDQETAEPMPAGAEFPPDGQPDHPAGVEPEPEGLGGPQTGQGGEAEESATPELTPAPGPPAEPTGEPGEVPAEPETADTTA